MKTPSSMPEFQKYFSSERSCQDYLFHSRWKGAFECPICGSKKYSFIATRSKYKCGLGHQVSFTENTVMFNSKEPLLTWFYGAWFVSTLSPGISAVQFQRQLGIKRYETAWIMLHKLRAALVAPDRIPLSGEVEIDETYIGGIERGTRQHGRDALTKTLVAVAVEIIRYKDKMGRKRSRAGRVRLLAVPDFTTETYENFVLANVAPKAIVHTDGHSSFRRLNNLGYDHRSLAKNELQILHRIVTNLKTWMQGTHKGAISRKHLQSYLDEFTFRFNRRFHPWAAFNRALGLASKTKSYMTYEEIYDRKPYEVHNGASTG